MKAISLWQPWASCCVLPTPYTGAPPKRFETRSWPFPDELEGERILIHASKKWTPDQAAFYAHLRDASARYLPEELPLGCIAGSVVLAGCSRTEDVLWDTTTIERKLGDYSPGRYAWRLEEAIAFDHPIPYAGRQKFFDVPPEVVAGQLAVHLPN